MWYSIPLTLERCLKDKFTQKWKFNNYLLSPILMESRVKFHLIGSGGKYHILDFLSFWFCTTGWPTFMVRCVLKHETELFNKGPPRFISRCISNVVRCKCVCWELDLFQNQVRRLKCLIICEVGLKLFPLLGDAIKWLSAGELRQIPRVNKSSRPAEAAVWRGGGVVERITADAWLLYHCKEYNMKTLIYAYV